MSFPYIAGEGINFYHLLKNTLAISNQIRNIHHLRPMSLFGEFLLYELKNQPYV